MNLRGAVHAMSSCQNVGRVQNGTPARVGRWHFQRYLTIQAFLVIFFSKSIDLFCVQCMETLQQLHLFR